MHTNDLELAARIASGDEDAATELFQALSGEMFGYARKSVGDANLAEDILQEGMLAVLKSIEKYDGRVALRSWSFGILRHKIVDALRKRGREPLASGADPEESNYDSVGHWKENVTLQPWNENAEVVDVVRQCMELLPHQQREALYLRALDGMSAKEVADVMEMSYANLRQVLHRARQAVRKCADQALGTAAGESIA